MTILVTGATGNVGRLVVDELLALGATDIRALTADPVKADLPAEVEVVRGYLGRLATMPAALAGVDRMYLAPLIATSAEVCRLAADAGIRQIVDLAGMKGGIWQPIEDAVEASGVPFVHLEPGEFMTNAGVWAAQIKAGDVVRDGYGSASSSLISLEDIAAVAARCLLEDGHEGRSYQLTGPESLTRRERVRQIGEALGRPLTYVELPHDELVEQLRGPMGDNAAWYADGLRRMGALPQATTPTVTEVTGRPGLTFAEWARRNTALFT
jgi:uncharacterized protein YbjT (DUF2867 family)